MKKLFTYFFIFLIPLGVMAQRGNYKDLGDKAFNKQDYYSAAFYYQQAADGKAGVSQNSVPFYSTGKYTRATQQADKLYITYQLAGSYRLYGDHTNAAIWYAKVVTDQDGAALYPLTALWYGTCLRANNNIPEALKQLQAFVAAYKGDAKFTGIANKEIEGCLFAQKQMLDPQPVEIAPLPKGLNGTDGDYALSINKGFYRFTSSRFIDEKKNHVNQVYSAQVTDLLNPTVIDLRSLEKNAGAEYGTPSLDTTGRKMYITRWVRSGFKTIAGIYFSQLQKGKWQRLQKLNTNVNADGFNARQPFITTDGKRLFFASNKPGGEGGDDIWVSDLDATGQPVNSTNLGSIINTPLDEQAPFYDDVNKKLVYSSNGLIGMGGFDLFESPGDIGRFARPVNMGYPINSTRDDLYYTPDPANASKFYISSGRGSDCCLSLFAGHIKQQYLSGIVVDCKTQQAFEGVKVALKEVLTKKVLSVKTTTANGKYSFGIKENTRYQLEISSKGYFTKVIPITAPAKPGVDTLINPDVCLQAYKLNVQVTIDDIYFDFGKADLRPRSVTVLDQLVVIMNDNPNIKIELGSHTDAIGSDDANLKLSQNRAQSCVNYLIAQGISSKRITAKGYGESMPVAPNTKPDGKDNPEGRQLNRRTTFTVKAAE